MHAYVATLSAEDLAGTVRYTDTSGNQHEMQCWQGFMQLLLHSMQHHSEIAAMLTAFGHSPGWIDFHFFVREQRKAQG